MNGNRVNLLFAAGGTGGHLFPATAVACYLREKYKDKVNCIFIGTQSRIESVKVPQLGFTYYGMPITAFPGKNIKALKYPFTFINSILKAKSIIKKEKVDAVICTGAYISYPPGFAANSLKKKLFLLESNVNPGKSILWLAPKATKIYTSYAKSADFFPASIASKINCLGNPVRQEILSLPDKHKAIEKYKLNPNKKTIFIFGGSLGARSINKAVESSLDELVKLNVNIIWQTGKGYTPPQAIPDNVLVTEFIDDMDTAYSLADLVIARSGATTVAELAVLGKPAILVPLPSASNNEQYENARMLDDSEAALLISDKDIQSSLIGSVSKLIEDSGELEQMSQKIKMFAKPDAASQIAEDIIKTVLI
jgi:UDP-N-acetylglucosamine--N-acetylmuramyl-(pentapeptide) pyrophosphoryl-undecaprenol N-acetylglucosamine transferase